MYVFIANGYKGIIESKQTVDIMSAIYPYPKYRKVKDYESALKFLNKFNRADYGSDFKVYGDTDKNIGYANISYIIDKDDLYVNIDTTKVGFIRVQQDRLSDTTVDNRPTMIKIKISDIYLNDDLISDHCVAISNILELLGGYVDVNINIPDISIYLALTKYTGDNYIINNCQEIIKNRLGGFSVTIKEVV